MNRYKLSKAGISAREGIERFNGNAEIYEGYLNKFPNDTSYADMCRAIAAGDVAAAFSAAHALKGLAGNLSMTKLSEDLCPLVEELRAGKLDRAACLLQAVSTDYERIFAALTEHL